MSRKTCDSLWVGESNVMGDEEVGPQARFRDRDTGIQKLRLTSRPFINTHIYPEAPICMPDGKRFIFRRTNPFTNESRFWMADRITRQIRQLTFEPTSGYVVITPDGQAMYFAIGRTIMRMSPDTFEYEPVYTVPDTFSRFGGVTSISHCGTRLLSTHSRGPDEHGAMSIDLKAQTCRVVYEHRDCRNAHAQYVRTNSYKVLVQVNDGILFDKAGNRLRLIGENGASIWVGNDDGSDFVKLNVGSQPLERVQGHQCWVGGQERVITTLHRRESTSSPWIDDRIVSIAPGEAKARLIAQGQAFNHIHTSRDGKWWVSDDNQTGQIFVGSMETGRYKLFVNSDATFGEAQFTHPHPCFLGNAHAIGWNSDQAGVPHVYVAEIPPGFLDDLL